MMMRPIRAVEEPSEVAKALAMAPRSCPSSRAPTSTPTMMADTLLFPRKISTIMTTRGIRASREGA